MSAQALERRIVTVLFADLVGFTPLAEQLDHEDVATLQQAYFAAVRETVGRYGGTLEKFIGDAVMAAFGIPRGRDDDAERAVRAGLALTSAIEQVGTSFGLDEPSLQVRVGINTGEVVIGGSDALATGDTINVAARFQTIAAPGCVVVGQTTALAVEDAIELEPLGETGLKGKAEAVRAWRAAAVRPQRSRDHAMGRLRAPLLGREEELRLLRNWLDGGVGRAVLVAPPGVGKTRLTTEFADRVELPVLRARLRPDAVAPYQPVAQLVSAALASAGVPLDRQAAWEAVRERSGARPARARVVADALIAAVWPAHAKERSRARAVDRGALFDAWLDGFAALAARARTVWLVEDVHWGGGDLLAFLAAAGNRGETLVLATSRPAVLEHAEAWCSSALVHELAPLSQSDAGQLVQALVGDALDDSDVDAIARASDGNALFIEELLRTWISAGMLEARNGGFRAVGTASEIPLPATVQAVYAAQIDDLPPHARGVARRASVAGRRFADGALAALDVSDAAAGLAVLERRALAAVGPADAVFGPTHIFRHALLRDAGYATLARADRARLHIELARWLERTAADSWAPVAEVIGRHYAAALDAAPRFGGELAAGVDKEEAARLAALWFERAASVSLDLAAHEAARSLLRRALELTPPAAKGDRARRLELLAEATAFAADMEEGAEALSEALSLYRELGDRAAVARAGYRLGNIRLQQLRAADALAIADDLLAELGESDDVPCGLLHVLRAQVSYGLTTELASSQPDIDRALEIARATGDESLEFAALRWGAPLPEPRLIEPADDDRTIKLAERQGHWTSVTSVYESRALLRIMEDRSHEATAEIARMEEVAATHGVTEALAWGDYLRCEQGLLRGDWDDAVAAGVRAIDLAERNGYTRVGIRTWMALSALAHARGDMAILQRLVEWIRPRTVVLARIPSPFARLMYEAIEIRLADAGLPIEPLLDQPLSPTFSVPFRQPAWFAGADTVFLALLARGELDAAADALRRFAARNAEWSSSMSRGFERLLQARLSAARGDGGKADAVRALEFFSAIQAPWWQGKALRLLGRDGEAEPIEHRLRLAGPAR